MHVKSVSEGDRRHSTDRIFHSVLFALRRGLPVVLNLCGDVCMWAYQTSTEPEILISSPAQPASSPGEGEIHTHAGNRICTTLDVISEALCFTLTARYTLLQH